jgi:hypothetical protein
LSEVAYLRGEVPKLSEPPEYDGAAVLVERLRNSETATGPGGGGLGGVHPLV